MKALVLCDGYGKKKSVEVDRPNVLIELKPDFPVIDKLLLDLATAGIDEVVLQTDVASDMLESALGYDRKGLRLTYKKTERTFEHIARLLADMDDDLLLIDGGIVTDINLTKMILKFNKATAPVILYTTIYEPQNVLDQSDDMFSCCESQEVFGGIICVRKGFDLTGFVLGDELENVFPMLADLGYLAYYNEHNFWDTLYTESGKARVAREWHNKTAKPWGYEKVQIITELYLLKELYIREGFQSSYHYHKKKDETMLITRGTGFIQFEDHRKYFEVGDTIHIRPYERHTIVASTDTILFEASTPFLEDTTRVKDYYPAR
ncbi:MAG: glucose-1-phosphate adenylyltransferase [Halobacteriota archaeon]